MIPRSAAVLTLAFFAVVVPLPAVAESGSASAEQAPLTVNVAADPALAERFASHEELVAHLDEIIDRASLIFHADIGRRLRLGRVEVGLPPKTGIAVDATTAFQWLAEKVKRHPARFWLFIINRPLAPCSFLLTVNGCALLDDSRSIISYNSDLRFVVEILLHEIGHNCGSGHSDSRNSIMHERSNGSSSYGDKTGIIREKCGQA